MRTIAVIAFVCTVAVVSVATAVVPNPKCPHSEQVYTVAVEGDSVCVLPDPASPQTCGPCDCCPPPDSVRIEGYFEINAGGQVLKLTREQIIELRDQLDALRLRSTPWNLALEKGVTR